MPDFAQEASEPATRRQAWLKRLADELLKLEPRMPMKNFLPEDDGPQWVKSLEREVGAIMMPVAKLKDTFQLSPKSMGAIIGHHCAQGVWLMEWCAAHTAKSSPEKQTDLPQAENEGGASSAANSFNDWYSALRRLAKLSLCSCVDQSYDDMRDFLLNYSNAFAKKPTGFKLGELGHSAFPLYVFMLYFWRHVAQLGSVRALHELLCKVFGTQTVGDLKRVEAICRRIKLHYRKPGRPKKIG